MEVFSTSSSSPQSPSTGHNRVDNSQIGTRNIILSKTHAEVEDKLGRVGTRIPLQVTATGIAAAYRRHINKANLRVRQRSPWQIYQPRAIRNGCDSLMICSTPDSLVAIKRRSLQVGLTSLPRIQSDNIANLIDVFESKDSLTGVCGGPTSIIYLFFVYEYIDVTLDDLLTSLTVDFEELHIATICKAVFALAPVQEMRLMKIGVTRSQLRTSRLGHGLWHLKDREYID